MCYWDNSLFAVNVSEADAFLKFHLAPLGLRRDIAVLGLLRKCALGLAHPLLCNLFPKAPALNTRHSGRLAMLRHDKQIVDRCTGAFTDVETVGAFALL